MNNDNILAIYKKIDSAVQESPPKNMSLNYSLIMDINILLTDDYARKSLYDLILNSDRVDKNKELREVIHDWIFQEEEDISSIVELILRHDCCSWWTLTDNTVNEDTFRVFIFLLLNREIILDNRKGSTYLFVVPSEYNGNKDGLDKLFFKYNYLNKDTIRKFIIDVILITSREIPYTPKDGRTFYRITFNDVWVPSEKFNEVFELLDEYNNIIEEGSPNTIKYRFRKGREDYHGVVDIGYMFAGCVELTQIELPSNWGDVENITNMFLGCKSLRGGIFPNIPDNLDPTTMFSKDSDTDISDINQVDDQIKKIYNDESDIDDIINAFKLDIGDIDIDTLSIPSCSNENLYQISFNDNWIPTALFKELFELIDENNRLVQEADPTTRHYRFRKGREDWKGIRDISELFRNCSSLVTINLPDNWGELTDVRWLFRYCTSLTDIVFPLDWSNVVDAEGILNNCVNLKNVVLPLSWNNVRDISYMFYNCEALVSVMLPDDWGTIRDTRNMFRGCSRLEHIVLPHNWGMIINTEAMFYNCISLNRVTIPSVGIPEDSTQMFYNCTSFTEILKGIELSREYYQSSNEGSFPEECYQDRYQLPITKKN